MDSRLQNPPRLCDSVLARIREAVVQMKVWETRQAWLQEKTWDMDACQRERDEDQGVGTGGL